MDALAEYKEVNLFLRGLIPTMGFQSDVVYFEVKKREAGQSKYTLKKMITLATDGITSMSTRPIQIITILGFLVSLFSFCMIIYCIIDWFSDNILVGNSWRVCGKDIFGNKGAAKVYCRIIYLEGSWG